MAAPTRPIGDRQCAACDSQADQWVQVYPGTEDPWRALCTRCSDLLKQPGTGTMRTFRTWSFM